MKMENALNTRTESGLSQIPFYTSPATVTQPAEGAFSLYIPAYWSELAILDGSWQPPLIQPVR